MTHQLQINHAADIFRTHQGDHEPRSRVTIEDLRTFAPFSTFAEFLERNQIRVYEVVA